MNFIQPQGGGDDCCCNGITGSSCTPQAWANACSIGYYLTDLCEENYLFRIKKDGTVIYGVSDANSYSFEPPSGEVATYAIEWCLGPEPCTWIELVEAEVDTTPEDACPMGIYGQTYVVAHNPPEGPMDWFVFCDSQLFVRVSALAAPGQVITHLWIDDVLYTPNTNYVGGLHMNPDGSWPAYAYSCHSGREYGHTDVGFDNATVPHQRVGMPLPFSKQTFSVRARQTNGLIIGCNVEFTCTAHYNAASITLPSWNGLNIACSGSSSAPAGWSSPLLGGVRNWCQNYESSIVVTPTDGLPGTFNWLTCWTNEDEDLIVARFDCEYIFRWDGRLKWVDSADPFPRPVYEGAFDFEMVANWSMVIRMPRTSSPGKFNTYALIQNIVGDVTVGVTGTFPIPADVASRILAIDPRGTSVYSRCYYFTEEQYLGKWFWPTGHTDLNCDVPYDEDVFNWNFIGPRFSSDHWQVWKQLDDDWTDLDFSDHLVVVPGMRPYLNGTWPVDTSFNCDLPEGSYYEITESAISSQFQV